MRLNLVALFVAVAVIALTASGAAAVPEDGLAPENETDNATVGICVVGVDSPCNGDNADDSAGDRVGSDDPDGGEMWIPEDQTHDGEIDERFRGDSTAEEHESEHTHGNTDDDHSHCMNEKPQILLPGDQNRDDQVDERFGGVPGFLEELFTSLVGLN